MSRRLGLAVLLALVALALAACGDDDAAPPVTGPPAATGATAPRSATSDADRLLDAFKQVKVPAAMVDRQAAGSPTARVTLTVFEDFQCPICLRYSLVSEPTVIQEYVVTGKVRYEFKNFPILGQESASAAIAASCAADQGRFWEYHVKLMTVEAEAGQLTKEQVDVGRFSPANLETFARDLGLDVAAFDACVGGTDAVDRVTAEVRQARDLGLRGTPSFLVNGQPLASYPPDAAGWRRLLDQAITAAK